MANNIIGKIPEFTTDENPQGEEEVPGLSPEQTSEPTDVEEKEIPSEPPAETTPTESPIQRQLSEDIGSLKTELQREVEGLRKAKEEIILELGELRGQRKAAKEAELKEVEGKIDDLKDLHPQDVETIERVLQAKGYVRQDSIKHILHEQTKKQEIQKFFSDYPEYSEKNDPEGKKFGAILKEVSLYKEPEDPTLFGVLLKKAHRAVAGVQTSSERGTSTSVDIKRRQVEIASVGSGGSQRSPSVTPFDSLKRQRLLDAGWSEEDVHRMEQRQK